MIHKMTVPAPVFKSIFRNRLEKTAEYCHFKSSDLNREEGHGSMDSIAGNKFELPKLQLSCAGPRFKSGGDLSVPLRFGSVSGAVFISHFPPCSEKSATRFYELFKPFSRNLAHSLAIKIEF